MSKLKKLITEIHHRSLWQVLLIYVGGGWLVFEVVQTVTEGLGLPLWFPAFAALLLLIGLPVVLATAFVREGEPEAAVSDPTLMPVDEARTEAARRRRFLTWRNAVASFVVALAVWGVVATGWMLFGERATREEVDARKSIAVLPFENLSPDPNDAYFTDGFHDEVLTHLQKIADLKVISRTSVMVYRDREENLRTIADELGVTHVLEGSVRRAGDQVRITTQLIEAEQDEHLWAENYQRELRDVFAVQADIAQRIASALKAQLTPEESERIAARPTENSEAYDLYLRGNEYSRRSTEEGDWRMAVQLWERSAELDPTFALPHAKLVRTHCRMRWWGYDRSSERLSRAEAAVSRLIQLAPDLGETHLALGWHNYLCLIDYDRALEEFARALETQPSNSDIYRGIAAVRRRQGLWDQAAENFETAVGLDPLSVSHCSELAETYSYSREYAKADSLNDRPIAMAPDDPRYYALKAHNYLRWRGDTKKAASLLERALEAIGPTDNAYFIYYMFLIDVCDADYGAALDWLSRVGPTALDTHDWVRTRAQLIAQIYGLQGEIELARAYYDSARVYLESRTKEQPDDARLYSSLGIAYAGLGLEEEAVQAGEAAVGLLPVSRDAVRGPEGLEALARIYTMVGDYDAALDQLDTLLAIPSYVSVPLLRIDPTWDALRDHPRFQALLAKYDSPTD